jgi:Flp pilus assembly CpaE family ATPase
MDRFLREDQFEKLLDLIRPKFPDVVLPLAP